jgi:hypothetical protein
MTQTSMVSGHHDGQFDPIIQWSRADFVAGEIQNLR